MADTEKSYPYATHLDVFYKPLELVDVPALVAACRFNGSSLATPLKRFTEESARTSAS